MIMSHRCHFCGDLASQVSDDVYLCDKLSCELAHFFPPQPQRPMGH